MYTNVPLYSQDVHSAHLTSCTPLKSAPALFSFFVQGTAQPCPKPLAPFPAKSPHVVGWLTTPTAVFALFFCLARGVRVLCTFTFIVKPASTPADPPLFLVLMLCSLVTTLRNLGLCFRVARFLKHASTGRDSATQWPASRA